MGAPSPRACVAVAAAIGSLLVGCGQASDQTPSAGRIAIRNAVLVTPATGAGTLSATVVNTSGRADEIVRVQARRGSTTLSVYQGGAGGWELLPAGGSRKLGLDSQGEPFIVRGIKPGQTVRLTMSFKHAKPVVLRLPAVADGPKYAEIFAYPLPTISRGTIVVRHGSPCAYVGYTIVSNGGVQRTMPDDVVVTDPGGRRIQWKHQTATGGPPDIVAMEEPLVVAPPDDDAGCHGHGQGGDADYVEASVVTVGQTVQVTFGFPAGNVIEPFIVVAG